jgi:hypothetical protein
MTVGGRTFAVPSGAFVFPRSAVVVLHGTFFANIGAFVWAGHATPGASRAPQGSIVYVPFTNIDGESSVAPTLKNE